MRQNLCSWPTSQTYFCVQRGGRKAGRMHSIPKWQRPDRWVTLSCVRAHSWPDGKCPLLPTTLTLPPAHLKTLDLGLSFQVVLSGLARGLKGSLVGLGWPQMRPPPCAEQRALSWPCVVRDGVSTTTSGTLSKPSPYHRKLMRRQSSGPWPSPQTISNYQGGLGCLPSCRAMALFNSAFIDSRWQAGVIFPAPISPKARQPRNTSLTNEPLVPAGYFQLSYIFSVLYYIVA